MHGLMRRLQCGMARIVFGTGMLDAMQPMSELAAQVRVIGQIVRIGRAAADQLPVQPRQPLRMLRDGAVKFVQPREDFGVGEFGWCHGVSPISSPG